LDVLITRNVDHLLNQPAPAVVFRADRYLINTGVMLIHPQTREHLDDLWSHFRQHFPRLTGQDPRRGGGPLGYGNLGGDGGDQELMVSYWAAKRRRVYELPVAYNAFAWQMDQTMEPTWCNLTAIVHKIARIRRMGQLGQVRAECVSYIQAHARWAQAPLPENGQGVPSEDVGGPSLSSSVQGRLRSGHGWPATERQARQQTTSRRRSGALRRGITGCLHFRTGIICSRRSRGVP